MPTDPYLEDSPITANRRIHSRQKLHSLAYIDLGPSNGGLVLNLSESGLAFSTAMKLMGDELPNLRFRLPGLDEAIEASARIIWMSESKKEAGARFEKLTESDARKINEWILTEQGLKARLEEAAFSDGLDDTGSPEPSSPESAVLEPPVPEPAIMKSKEQETELGLSCQTSAWLTQDLASVPRKRGISAAIITVIAVISFGTGVVIERRFHHISTNAVDPVANEGAKAAEGTAPSPASPAIDKAALEGEKQSGNASNNLISSAGKPSVAASDKETIAPERVEAGHETKASRPTHVHDNENRSETPRLDASRKDAVRDSGPSSTKMGITLSTENANRRSAVPRQAAEQKRTEASAPHSTPLQTGNAMASAPRQFATIPKDPPEVSASEKPVPQSFTPAAAKPLTPSIAVRMPPFPSMRIPPQLKSQASHTGTSLQMGQLISRIEPTYPAEAVRQEIAGTVKVRAAIARDGAVQSLEANGPPMLAEAAKNAVRQWRFKPTLLDGQAIEAEEEIVFLFRLSPANP